MFGALVRRMTREGRTVRRRTEGEREAADLADPSAEVSKYVVDLPRWDIAGGTGPQVVRTEPPPALSVRDRLLTARERRAIHEYEVKNRRAQKLRQRAVSQSRRMHHLLRSEYRSGALQIDDPDDPASEVYRDVAQRSLQQRRAATAHEEARRAHIRRRQVPVETHGFDPLAFDPRAEAQEQLWARKGRAEPPKPRRTEGGRPRSVASKRAEHLRFQETRGRHYNVVTGAELW